VLHREPVAKNVCLYVVDKPEGFTSRPGHAVELAVDQPGWSDDQPPFTLCGPPKMVEELTKVLKSLGANTDSLVFEK
jgi:NAD(P)H-flavin reductase